MQSYYLAYTVSIYPFESWLMTDFPSTSLERLCQSLSSTLSLDDPALTSEDLCASTMPPAAKPNLPDSRGAFILTPVSSRSHRSPSLSRLAFPKELTDVACNLCAL